MTWYAFSVYNGWLWLFAATLMIGGASGWVGFGVLGIDGESPAARAATVASNLAAAASVVGALLLLLLVAASV